MKDFITTLCVCVCVVTAVSVFSQRSIGHKYFVECAGEILSNGKCNPADSPRLTKVKYTVSQITGNVVLANPDYIPQLFEHCAIVDVDNWHCPNPKDAANIHQYYCSNGDCDFWIFNGSLLLGHTKQISEVEYYFYSAREYLFSTQQK